MYIMMWAEYMYMYMYMHIHAFILHVHCTCIFMHSLYMYMYIHGRCVGQAVKGTDSGWTDTPRASHPSSSGYMVHALDNLVLHCTCTLYSYTMHKNKGFQSFLPSLSSWWGDVLRDSSNKIHRNFLPVSLNAFHIVEFIDCIAHSVDCTNFGYWYAGAL